MAKLEFLHAVVAEVFVLIPLVSLYLRVPRLGVVYIIWYKYRQIRVRQGRFCTFGRYLLPLRLLRSTLRFKHDLLSSAPGGSEFCSATLPFPDHVTGGRQCDLCLTEKLFILKNFNNPNYLNKRSELALKCRHKAKFLLIPPTDREGGEE